MTYKTVLHILIALSLIIVDSVPLYAQVKPSMPVSGHLVLPSEVHAPSILRGITVLPHDPLRFQFLMDTGDDNLQDKLLEQESLKQLQYFLAGLTIPEEDIWVNLSPYERDRMIPDDLGETTMGVDMLAQDYLLKQLTSSFLYPDEEVGRAFWKRVYEKMMAEYGTTDLPVDTFNKVWIVPDKAVVYEHGHSAFVGERHLKVMTERDYVAAQQTNDNRPMTNDHSAEPNGKSIVNGHVSVVSTDDLSSEVIKDIIIPELEKEVNEGESFAPLRQIFNALILATWYKNNLKSSLLNQVYADQNKTVGVDVLDKTMRAQIYEQYLGAFKEGAFSLIREEVDPVTQQSKPRHYFSGGVTRGVIRDGVMTITPLTSLNQRRRLEAAGPESSNGNVVVVDAAMLEQSGEADLDDTAMLGTIWDSLKWIGGKNINRLFDRMIKTGVCLMACGIQTQAQQSELRTEREFVFRNQRPAPRAQPSVRASAPRMVMPQEQGTPLDWLALNVFEDGMPRSFQVPSDPEEAQRFWERIGEPDVLEDIIERIIINDGSSTYDSAAQVITLAFSGESELLEQADSYGDILRSGRWGALREIRANGSNFDYQGQRFGPGEGLFFRLISSNFFQSDPLTGATRSSIFPTADGRYTWLDWKAILGENAWTVMSQVQLALQKYGRYIEGSPEDELIQSMIPAFVALLSPTGGFYHAPGGTADKDPFDISSENNQSLHSALKMLEDATGDIQYRLLREEIERYFRDYAYDMEQGIYTQGGFWNPQTETFAPNPAFAVDVQTWGILTLTPEKIDSWHGEGAAYRMWSETKRRAGYFDRRGELQGVGFTDGHDVLSVEWTAGAIGAALELHLYYKDTHPEWAEEALRDAIKMLFGVERYSGIDENGNKYYLYTNVDHYVIFGWNGRPIPSTASTAWMKSIHQGKNFFVLGGETRWMTIRDFRDAVGLIELTGGGRAVSVRIEPDRSPVVRDPQPVDPTPIPDPEPTPEPEGPSLAEIAAVQGEVDSILSSNVFRRANPNQVLSTAAFRSFIDFGLENPEIVTPYLAEIFYDTSRHSDLRKWVALAIGLIAPLDEVDTGSDLDGRRILNDIIGSNVAQPWHRTEALNGLNELDERLRDGAMFARQSAAPLGGIDLNMSSLNLQILRDDAGVPLPAFQQDFAQISVSGFKPFIIDILPATPQLILNNIGL